MHFLLGLMAATMAACLTACGERGRPAYPSSPIAGASEDSRERPIAGDQASADEEEFQATVLRASSPQLLGSVLDPQHAFAPGMEGRLSYMSRRFPVLAQAEIAILPDADSFLAARVLAMRGAQRSIRLQTFIYRGDETGRLFNDELCAASKRGIDVRVLVDDKINIVRSSQRLFEELRRCGAKLEGYERTFFRIFDLLLGREGALSSFELFNMRAHDKILVVDGEDATRAVGFVGGTNVANEYFQIAASAKHVWRDQDLAARGALAVNMSQIFDQNFEDHMRLRTDPRSASRDSFWNVVFAHRKNPETYGSGAVEDEAIAVEEVEAADNYVMNMSLEAIAERRANAQITLDWQSAVGSRFLQSRPRLKETFIHHAYLDLFRSAKREITIFNSYFVPTSEIQEALLQAVARGVQVRIATNGPSASDLPIVQTAGRSFFRALMQWNGRGPGKLEIKEWRADAGLKNGMGTHHAKYAVVDGEMLLVGSYNLDPRSQFLNSETVVVAYQPQLAAQLLAIFDKDTGPRFSVGITAAEAARFQEPKGFLNKLRLDFANRFMPLLYN